MRTKAVFLIITFSITFSIFSQLSSEEQKIIQTVDKNNTEAISFLEKVVNINSGTLNTKGVKKVGEEFAKAFESIDLKTRWIPLPVEMKRAGHLFAKTAGAKGKRIILVGHLDTVFEENSPFQKFKKVNDSIAYAPGGNDMKGGNVIVLYALKALHENNLLKDAQIVVAFTGDEESAGRPLSVSRKDFIEIAKKSDIALGFETSTGYNYATVARRGSINWQLETTGVRKHSSVIFSKGVGAGAIFEMSRILNEFYKNLKGEKYLTFNPGVVAGGTFANEDKNTGEFTVFGKTNVVAQKVVVKGGLRCISEEQVKRTKQRMKKIVANNLPNTTATITFGDSYPPMSPLKGNKELLQKLSKVSLDLGQGEVIAYDPAKRGAADVSFIAQYVDCLDGLGTIGTGAHTTEETVNLKTIKDLTKRTAILIYRLIKE